MTNRQFPSRRRSRVAAVGPAIASVLCGLLVVSGCGSLASDQEVVAGAGGTTVRLDEAQFNALRQGGGIAGGAGNAAAGAGAGTAGEPGAPVPGGAQPAAFGSTDTEPGTTRDAKGATTPTAKSGGAAPDTTPGRSAAGQGAACTGSLSPIVVGQVGGFSGVTGPINSGARTGLAVWAKAVNAQGGVACHPVSVVAVDDGGDPSRAQAAVADLVKNKGAVAVLASFVQLTYEGLRAGFESQRVPAIGGDLASPDWYTSKFAYPQGASITMQAVGAYKQGVDVGRKKLAVFYCVESSVCLNLRKVTEGKGGAAEMAGAQVVYSSQVSLTQPDFTAQCQNAKNAGADVIAAAVDGSATIRIARSCKSLNYFPMFATGAMAIGAQQGLDPQLQKNRLAIASSVFPWTSSDTPAQGEFQTAMKELSGIAPDGPASIAWASGQIFAKALANLGAEGQGSITPALVQKGLGKIKNETLGGLIAPITYKPGEFAPQNRCVFYVLLTEQGWSAPRGSKPVCL